MNFIVNFIPEKKEKHIIYLKGGSCGLDLVQKVRQSLNDNKIQIHNIHIGTSFANSFNMNIISIIINETLAKECKHFENKDSIEVKVSKGLFDKYVIDKIELEGTSVEVSRLVNKDKILSDWKTTNFPRYWKEVINVK